MVLSHTVRRAIIIVPEFWTYRNPELHQFSKITYQFIRGGLGLPLTVRPGDLAVLRLLAEHELELTAPNVARNIPYSTGYVRKVLKKLVREGFVSIDDTGGDPFYQITDEGRAYLED